MTSYRTSPTSPSKHVIREDDDTRPLTVRERIARELAKLPSVDANGREIPADSGGAIDTVRPS